MSAHHHAISPRSQGRIEQVDDGTRKGSIINHAGGAMCAGCHTSVDDGKTAVAVRALGKQWHKECFTCTHCKHAIGTQFSSHEGKAYCDPCFEKHVAKAACPGCRKLVVGHFVKALGRDWHRECFVCATCKKGFPDNVYEIGEDNAPYHPNC